MKHMKSIGLFITACSMTIPLGHTVGLLLAPWFM